MLAARAPFRIAKNSWRQRPSRGGRRLVRHAPEATAGPAMAPAQFERLAEKLKELKALESVGDALDWDQLVMLPEGGNGLRAKQKSALAAAVHEKSTDPKLGEMIAEAERVKDELDASQAAALREARRAYDMEAKKPAELAKRDAELEAEAYEVWASAKDASNFSQFAPKLDELVSLKKEIATKVRPEMDPYDHMIDLFCRGLSRERVRHILTSIRDGLQPLVAQLKNVKQPDVGPLNHNSGTKFPHEKQIALAREVSAKLGYDFSRGRLDESKHPFTGGLGPHDVRITTRVNESDPLSCLMATIHESGHAIYEQQKSWDHDLLPVQQVSLLDCCNASSPGRRFSLTWILVMQALDMSVHESQSIIMERMVAQSRAFWEFAAPIVRKHFPELEGVSADAMYRAVNIAKPSLIRVEADELTYPMHIVLRFEIEQVFAFAFLFQCFCV